MKINYMKLVVSFLVVIAFAQQVIAQDDLESMLDKDKPKKEFVKNAFKSPRVINGHSMEMIGKGVLDFRILHRFGTFKSGYRELFGLDQASMRMGFDYGLGKNFTIGIGRSTFQKEVDGFAKYRIIHQAKGEKAIPFSLIWTSGFALNTTKIENKELRKMENRLAYYHQLIIGRKFTNFTLQLSPTLVHRNLVPLESDKNDMIAIGIGGRMKLSNRMALILDTYPILYGATKNVTQMPLSLGVDIETGGHVFQLHITNTKGMNEKAFIAETNQTWGKGQIQFGFNLSRVFTIVKNTEASW
jgi:hypothetical protein